MTEYSLTKISTMQSSAQTILLSPQHS